MEAWRRTFKEDPERVRTALEYAEEVATDCARWRQWLTDVPEAAQEELRSKVRFMRMIDSSL